MATYLQSGDAAATASGVAVTGLGYLSFVAEYQTAAIILSAAVGSGLHVWGRVIQKKMMPADIIYAAALAFAIGVVLAPYLAMRMVNSPDAVIAALVPASFGASLLSTQIITFVHHLITRAANGNETKES